MKCDILQIGSKPHLEMVRNVIQIRLLQMCLSPDAPEALIRFQNVFSVTWHQIQRDGSTSKRLRAGRRGRQRGTTVHRNKLSALRLDSGIVCRVRWWINISQDLALESHVVGVRSNHSLRCCHGNQWRCISDAWAQKSDLLTYKL